MSSLEYALLRMPIPDNLLFRALSNGHLSNRGHKLDGYVVVRPDGSIRMIRTCCEERT